MAHVNEGSLGFAYHAGVEQNRTEIRLLAVAEVQCSAVYYNNNKKTLLMRWMVNDTLHQNRTVYRTH